MKKKPTIFWFADGVGWGFDIRAEYLTKLLPNFNHEIFKAMGKTSKQTVETVKKSNADIIFVMSPRGLWYFPKRLYKKIVVGLSSIRTLQGWQR